MKFIKIDNTLYNSEKLMTVVGKRGLDDADELLVTFSDGKTVATTSFEKERILNIIKPPEETPDERVRRSELARIETKYDLEKSIEQLVRDVHHDALDPTMTEEHKLLYGTRRMVSMMGRVALEHEKTSKALVRLTYLLVVMIVALIILAGPSAFETFEKYFVHH
jgi:hypothetical protein